MNNIKKRSIHEHIVENINPIVHKHTVESVPLLNEDFVDDLINTLNHIKIKLQKAKELVNRDKNCNNVLDEYSKTKQSSYNLLMWKLYEYLLCDVPTGDKDILFKILNFHKLAIPEGFVAFCENYFSHIEDFEFQYLDYRIKNPYDFFNIREELMEKNKFNL